MVSLVYEREKGHFRVLMCLCFKTSLSAKPFIWKWVLHAVSFSCKLKSFHNNGFALSLALKQRHKGTRKWPIGLDEPQEHMSLKIFDVFAFLSTNRTLVIVVQTYFIAFKTEETSEWNTISVLTLNCITIKSAYTCLRHKFKQSKHDDFMQYITMAMLVVQCHIQCFLFLT